MSPECDSKDCCDCAHGLVLSLFLGDCSILPQLCKSCNFEIVVGSRPKHSNLPTNHIPSAGFPARDLAHTGSAWFCRCRTRQALGRCRHNLQLAREARRSTSLRNKAAGQNEGEQEGPDPLSAFVSLMGPRWNALHFASCVLNTRSSRVDARRLT